MTDFGQNLPTRPGDVFAGKYRVERVLGAGGMGVVVAAMHVDLGELRAIKFMLPSVVGDTVALERFFREARAASKLKSDHVARVHDVGRTDQMAPYIVMEYLEGRDLSSLVKDGPLPIERAVDYVIQACDAIAEAHAAGIVHRDLKPANLFLTTGADGSPCIKVLDFGISKVGDAGAPSQLTDTEATIGSPYHMSPEQMRDSSRVDLRSDIWSLGVVLYQLVTGALPFEGDGRYAVCFAIVEDEPVRPRVRRADVPAALEAAILRCLEKKPDARFQDVAAFCDAIAQFSPAPETAVRVRRIRRLAGGKLGESTTDPGAAMASAIRSATSGAAHPAAARTDPSDGSTESSWGKGPVAREKGRSIPLVIGGSFVAIAALAAAARFFVWPAAHVSDATATRPTADAVNAAPPSVASVVAAPEPPASESPVGSASASASASASEQPPAPSASAPKPARASQPWTSPPRPATPQPPTPPPGDPWGRTRKL